MKRTRSNFEGLLSRYFEQMLEDHPAYATVQGIVSAQGKLGECSPEFLKKREQARQACLAALDEINPRELDHEQHLDRLALRSLLLRECEDFKRRRHEMDPGAPEQVLSILLHEVLRSDDDHRRAARNLRSLLQQAPDYLEEAVTVLRNPERVWLGIMEEAVEGAPTLLAAVKTLIDRGGSDKGADHLVEGLSRALRKYRDKACSKKPAAAGSFAVGEASLQRRVRDDLGLDYTLGQVEQLALGEVKRVGELLRVACAGFGRKKKAGEIIEEQQSQWRPNKPLIDLYREETERIASGFRARRAVTFPQGEQLVLKPVPEFLSSIIPTAAYDAPGAFAKRQRGIFWVNDLGLKQRDEASRVAERQQHFGIPLTCAHEGYPGHHLQFVVANQHPRKWRRLFAHAVFYEGWTLWCEQMMVDLGIEEAPWLRVRQLHDALWRCHRILIDLRLQTGRYSARQAAEHLQKHLGFTLARSEAEANWYSGQPGVPMSYWLGRLENERLRRRLMKGRGWPLRKFNDWLLSFGTLPQSWIERYGLD